MAPPSFVRLAMVITWALWISAALASDHVRLQTGSFDYDSNGAGGASRGLGGSEDDERGDENIVLTEGIVFQTTGCPQLMSEVEAMRKINDTAVPGNVIHLVSEGPGRAGNHFLVLSAYLAMAYCCKSKVLQLPHFDPTIPTLSETLPFVARHRFFDFSGVDTMPLEEYNGLSQNAEVCPPKVMGEGMDALFLIGVHPDLMRCMNRVYLRGCEAKYLEPLLGTSNICQNPPASGGRFLQNNDSLDQDHHVRPEKSSLYDGRPQRFPSPEEKEQEQGGNAEEDVLNGRRGRLGGGKEDFSGKRPHLGLTNRDLSETEPSVVVRGTDGSAGSLVIHIRSGDIFLPRNIPKLKHSFHTYGQPPLQFYLWVIASQPWSDVSIITFAPDPIEINPTFAALEAMQVTGVLGPNVVTHMHRDLLTDIRAMLCADGLATSRSTLHFLTVAHSRAKHFFVPSECGPGAYKRSTRDLGALSPKPNPNNTTLMCIEKPDAEVYGVVWEGGEEAYGLYNGWQDTDRQLLDMVLFDGVKGLARCCAR